MSQLLRLYPDLFRHLSVCTRHLSDVLAGLWPQKPNHLLPILDCKLHEDMESSWAHIANTQQGTLPEHAVPPLSHLRLISHSSRRRQWHPTPVLSPGKSHGQRSLVGCSPWGRYESDTTERLHFHFSLSCIGEGNGNSLQYSCLENPRDREAWWAAVYGVIQSQT